MISSDYQLVILNQELGNVGECLMVSVGGDRDATCLQCLDYFQITKICHAQNSSNRNWCFAQIPSSRPMHPPHKLLGVSFVYVSQL